MFNHDPGDLFAIALRTSVVYVFLLLALRVAGKRELGQLRLFDLVVILVISNAVQNAMVGPDTSVSGGLVAAGILILLNWAVGRLTLRSTWLGLLLAGSPTVLVYDGQVMDVNMRREGVSDDELTMALHEHGYESPSDVKLAMLEVDGTISVVARDVTLQRSRRRVRGRKPGE